MQIFMNNLCIKHTKVGETLKNKGIKFSHKASGIYFFKTKAITVKMYNNLVKLLFF